MLARRHTAATHPPTRAATTAPAQPSILQAVAICLILCAPTTARATQTPPNRTQAPHVTVSLLSDRAAVQPGQHFTAGVRFQLERGWHVYWRNPGDTGLEPRLRWTLPDGYAHAPTRWPAPSRIPLQHLMNFGYEGQTILLTTITPPPDTPIGRDARISVKADWLVCKENCLPGTATLVLSLPVKPTAVPNRETSALFTTYQQRLPLTPEQLGWRLNAQLLPQAVRITLTPTAPDTPLPENMTFFPDHPNLIHNPAPQRITHRENALRIDVTRSPEREHFPPPDRLRGVLVTEPGWPPNNTNPAMRVDTPWSDPDQPLK